MIDMKYGRKDAESSGGCVDEGNLPAGSAPFPKADTPQARSCLVFAPLFLPVKCISPIPTMAR